MTTQISNAAGAVATAKVDVGHAAAALVDAEGARDLVRARLDEKRAERAEIVGARKAGTESAKDGARLMTLAADLEGLAELLAEAEADVTKAAAEADKAKRALVQEEANLARRTDEELLVRLVARAVVLDGMMVKNIKEIADTWKRLGKSPGRETWTPTVELADLIKRIDLTRENRK